MTTLSKDYKGRINQVQDYIEDHLDDKLELSTLAKITHFSEYYFHRLYSLASGESLYGFIKRLRLERAAFKLREMKQDSITDIALSVGFGNSSSFAKAFKNYYGISASDYRKGKNGQVTSQPSYYNKDMAFEDYVDELTTYKPLNVEIQNIEAKRMVYTRYTGEYRGNADLFGRLFTDLYEWVMAKGLLTKENQFTAKWLTLYHDLGSMTKEDFLRVSVCMEVDHKVDVDGDIGYYTMAGGQYVVARYEVVTEDYQKAWDHMFLHWLPQSAYEHDDRLPYEAYPFVKPSKEGYRLVDICIPIKPRK